MGGSRRERERRDPYSFKYTGTLTTAFRFQATTDALTAVTPPPDIQLIVLTW